MLAQTLTGELSALVPEEDLALLSLMAVAVLRMNAPANALMDVNGSAECWSFVSS
jgi:hypothetical protein